MRRFIIDSRIKKGRIWNIKEVLLKFPFGNEDSKWNKNIEHTDEKWIDEFVYSGFCEYGNDFLKSLGGKFAILFHDEIKNRLFLARDWIGEIPFHYLATQTGLYFANSIDSIKKKSGEDYLYDNIRAFPQSHYQIIDFEEIDENNISATFRPDRRELFNDFEGSVKGKIDENLNVKEYDFSQLAILFKNSILKRASTNKQEKNYLLLSGGLDSLTVAVAMKTLNLPFETFTLSVGNKSGEAEIAANFAQKLGVKHHIINVTIEEVIKSYFEGVHVSEIYHIYNVYCSVGMLLLGKKLEELGINHIFCGEAMNEAVGDYKDWVVYDPIEQKNLLIQKINTKRLQNIKERTLYVWGHSVDKGKYNRQLGTGLAKHAGARMIKPFLKYNIDLECPYYDTEFLSAIVAYTPDQLNEIGYKPGLVWRIFEKDFLNCGFDEPTIKNCKKVRLQDSNENGESGISSVLIGKGFDQEKTLNIFNRIFKSNYNTTEKAKSLLCTM